MGAINYSRGGWVMQYSRQKCWDEGPCGLRGGVGGLCGGVGGLCGARARPDVVRADTGGASRARRGRTRRRHGLRCDGAFLAREERALPKARVLLPYPRRGGQGSGQAQTRGRVLLRPRLPRHARRRRAGLRVLQAMEGAHWPPATDALAIVHTAGLLTHTILTRPTEETRPSAPLCGIRPRLGHLARPCAT